MILNIRGTSGSGKSWIVYELMKLCGATEQLHDADGADHGKVIGYSLFDNKLGVVGRYETACGGCDTIKTQDEIRSRVEIFATLHDHVLFEGLLVSQIYQRYADMAREHGEEFKFLCLDTPLDVCIARVEVRRLVAGNSKPFNPNNSLTPKWHSCQTNYQKALKDGLNPIWLDHRDPLAQIRELLNL